MIKHVFKLVWNRKRSTGLILVEILICFLVLCGILAVRYRNPAYGTMVLCCLYIAAVWGRHGIGYLVKHKVHSQE